ncbi:N-terminal phage integrase SAM-like domain-containing protein [Actinoplanes sp. RD1]|uniref:N-terminal phage integrase SAM-like domain-containing protein n=1 Tax=Actinoplanes sp. RD1 TaxID=3064538 RepID=UPI002741962D|nr:N-terminal phage integrase SAM-like domain-containing protein [Actinoplanes sp. RD1]
MRYIAQDGRERSKSFPDRSKRLADDFLASVEADKLRGHYLDPSAGKRPFDAFAEQWLRTHRLDESTRVSVRSRVRNHIIPFFGARPLSAAQPSTVREWDAELIDKGLASSTRAVLFAHLSASLRRRSTMG